MEPHVVQHMGNKTKFLRNKDFHNNYYNNYPGL